MGGLALREEICVFCARKIFSNIFFGKQKLPSSNKMMSPLEFLGCRKTSCSWFFWLTLPLQPLVGTEPTKLEAGSDGGRSDSTGLIRLVRLLRIVRIARIARCRLGRPLGETSRMMTSPGFRWLKRWKLQPFPPWPLTKKNRRRFFPARSWNWWIGSDHFPPTSRGVYKLSGSSC